VLPRGKSERARERDARDKKEEEKQKEISQSKNDLSLRVRASLTKTI